MTVADERKSQRLEQGCDTPDEVCKDEVPKDEVRTDEVPESVRKRKRELDVQRWFDAFITDVEADPTSQEFWREIQQHQLENVDQTQ